MVGTSASQSRGLESELWPFVEFACYPRTCVGIQFGPHSQNIFKDKIVLRRDWKCERGGGVVYIVSCGWLVVLSGSLFPPKTKEMEKVDG